MTLNDPLHADNELEAGLVNISTTAKVALPYDPSSLLVIVSNIYALFIWAIFEKLN